MTKYLVTKFFTHGVLKGITITETTVVKFKVGHQYSKYSGGSPYIVTEVTQIP